jgi:uncharacterized protein
MRSYTIVIVLLFGMAIGLGQENFLFEGEELRPGTKGQFEIAVTDGRMTTVIPITVFHGATPGPVLGITAGIHGFEYPPILAALEFAQRVDPKKMTGTLILVHLANVPAFLGRTPFLNPLDEKNLNRSFPGSPDGSITDRMAHTITEKIIARSDYFVDIHAGDAPEDLFPYNAWYHSKALPDVSEKGRAMAMAMGFDYAVIFDVPEQRLAAPSLYCSQEAFHRKIPTVDIECGGLGSSAPEAVNTIVDALFGLLHHLEMGLGAPLLGKETVTIAKRASMKSSQTGICHMYKKAGDQVLKGEQMGHITDFFGTKIADITAEASGVILYLVGTPPINSGETLVSIGILED